MVSDSICNYERNILRYNIVCIYFDTNEFDIFRFISSLFIMMRIDVIRILSSIRYLVSRCSSYRMDDIALRNISSIIYYKYYNSIIIY